MAKPAKAFSWTRVLVRTFYGAVSLGLAWIALVSVIAGLRHDYIAFLLGLLFLTLSGVALHFALYPDE
jgi:hypothetical protein